LADASLVETQAPLAIERDMPANPKAGKALLPRLVFGERFDMINTPGGRYIFASLVRGCKLEWGALIVMLTWNLMMLRIMSALPPNVDIVHQDRDVRFVPKKISPVVNLCPCVLLPCWPC